ncbi:glycosyltransferase family 4 protein [Lelliottia sp. V106_10]|uniref:glycosyltransferase family 4 protein n=1 Tax=Lelliottia wanjuensis TaxID=3050585 RepID=UPI002549D216|nr:MULTISPECIES: glycosyltransferase family 4 protein [unclassified Lelliottia]MDK9358878.1 glycosyltransferase family 4 protein [Lelliottia sp. V106_16]MDK9373565.1 glycosyltransferase family 4 protein [Lelliottia sp. V106_10]MDK9600394.1 glycosyltransferase family 4 protein [Lelliottia sp. V106_5]
MSHQINMGIVADWLITWAGAEKVISECIGLYPDAQLYSVVDFLSEENRALIQNKEIITTFIQGLPFARRKYQNYLPLMPLAIEQLDVSGHDVILSSSYAVAKGVLTGPDQLHISYVHSPVRYAWDLQHQYLHETGLDCGMKGMIARWLLHKIRLWDYRTANGVDHFLANSQFIARRIKKVYGRDADVIYPPVDTSAFTLSEYKEEYYLTASRLVPYKRVDLLVEAFSHMPGRRLVVIGDGPEMEKIKRKASSNVEILGYQSDENMKAYMQGAKAFLFASVEDFGITPVEAQACGTPVIALARGGACETIRPFGERHATGLFFARQDVASVMEAVERFDRVSHLISPEDCRINACRFSAERFREELSGYIEKKWETFSEKKHIIY